MARWYTASCSSATSWPAASYSRKTIPLDGSVCQSGAAANRAVRIMSMSIAAAIRRRGPSGPLALAPPNTAPATPIHGRELVDEALFSRLAARVATDRPEYADLAERIVDQALAFLGTCADQGPRGLVPSPLVDVGWHTFILFTRDYAAFCARV